MINKSSRCINNIISVQLWITQLVIESMLMNCDSFQLTQLIYHAAVIRELIRRSEWTRVEYKAAYIEH